jgi:hypothetical protein
MDRKLRLLRETYKRVNVIFPLLESSGEGEDPGAKFIDMRGIEIEGLDEFSSECRMEEADNAKLPTSTDIKSRIAQLSADPTEKSSEYQRSEDPKHKLPFSQKDYVAIGASDDVPAEIEKRMEWLKNEILKPPRKLISQNTKLAKSGGKARFFDLTLPAFSGIYYSVKDDDFKVVRTCPSAGACKKFCYATKGGYIQYPINNIERSRVLSLLMNNPEGFKNQLLQELKEQLNKASGRSKFDKVVLRWHDSGDFFSSRYLRLAYEVAKDTPNITHYAYTKQVSLIKRLSGELPDNFIFNFSYGGVNDAAIDREHDKHSDVIPMSMFKDLNLKRYLIIKKKLKNELKKVKNNPNLNPEMIDRLKQRYRVNLSDIETQMEVLKERVAEEMGIPEETIITYDELIKTEEDPNREPKFNVLVASGNGDDSAARKDVLGTYLLEH